MNGVLGQVVVVEGYAGPGTNWAIEFVMNHTPGAGSITKPVYL